MLKKVSNNRSTFISDAFYESIKNEALAQATLSNITKECSTEDFEKRKPLDLSGDFIKSCTAYGAGMYEADNGVVWKVAKDDDGESWLEIDDELTLENKILNELMS